MNHVFRVVWNEARGCWLAVAEHAPGRGKSSSSKAVAAVVLAAGGVAAHGQVALVDGHGGTGCNVMVTGANCSLPNSNAIFTNFYT
ncbi:MAG: ESPR domain-containing protein, partial [Aquincola sp.]|nr:ESPR domain-containing protein [Aquincola sp.]